MTDERESLEAIERAAAELLPQLGERLARHGLGEIEVRHGELRMRVAGSGAVETAPAPRSARPQRTVMTPAAGDPAPGSPPPPTTVARSAQEITSPAVGFFVYADGLGPGLTVDKGDGLGWIEMLGVRHDVRAPRRGTVRNLVAESGEAVEYGQVVLDLEPTEASA